MQMPNAEDNNTYTRYPTSVMCRSGQSSTFTIVSMAYSSEGSGFQYFGYTACEALFAPASENRGIDLYLNTLLKPLWRSCYICKGKWRNDDFNEARSIRRGKVASS